LLGQTHSELMEALRCCRLSLRGQARPWPGASRRPREAWLWQAGWRAGADGEAAAWAGAGLGPAPLDGC